MLSLGALTALAVCGATSALSLSHTEITMITGVLITLLSVLLVIYAIVNQAKPRNFPPGPNWWPFLGNGYMLRKLAKELNGQHLAFSKLAKDYGTSLLGLRLGGEFVVVGFTPKVVKEILSRNEFNGRPDSFFIKLRCFGKREGVTGSDGLLWQQQRAFVVRHLRVFGFDRASVEDLVTEQVKYLVESIGKEGKAISLGRILASAVMSVLWGLVAGKKLDGTDERLGRLLDLLNRRSRAFDMAGGYLNQFPWLRFLAPEKTGYNLLVLLNSELKQFLTEIVEEHKKSYDPNSTRDLIDAFLHERYSENNGSDSSFNSDSNLIVVLLDLFIAGSQTTSSTLDFAFLYMLKYPEIQEKVYRCLRDNVGANRIPKMSDRQRLGYVEAVLAEVQRLCNVVPVCGPRRCLEDVELDGYFIPKNSTVLISLWSVHKDESLFDDPDTFNPERFLDSNGRFVNGSKIIPFGLGKRRCLGDILAKSCIFLMFSGLVNNFRIRKLSGDPEPSLEPLHGITLAPKEYVAEFVPR